MTDKHAFCNWLLNMPKPKIGDTVQWGVGLSDTPRAVTDQTGKEITLNGIHQVMALYILKRNGFQCYYD